MRQPQIRSFTEKQIALLKTFSNQAVIAIENVRLYKEIQERDANCAKRWTSGGNIRSAQYYQPFATDVQPVLDAIVESAAKVCGIDDVALRSAIGTVWFRGLILVQYPFPMAASRSVLMRRRSLDARAWDTPHSRCPCAERYPDAGFSPPARALLVRSASSAGRPHWRTRRASYRGAPFHAGAIKLLKTFADQAVIAIENVRLFQELKESLEQRSDERDLGRHC